MLQIKLLTISAVGKIHLTIFPQHSGAQWSVNALSF